MSQDLAIKQKRQRHALTIAAAVVLIGLIAFAGYWWLHPTGLTVIANDQTAPDHVGSSACATCHSKQFQQWQGSHHQLAMQPANTDSVLGDFSKLRVEQGAGGLFTHEKDNFVISTTGPDKQPHDYPVPYTFGVYPLQQYLLGLPGGRLQAFDLAWDSRSANAGGQRWFALYDEAASHVDSPLHWSAIDQNWNDRCSHCHSTGVKKQYQPESRDYATQQSEIGVGCEACHGPGSAHVDWARSARSEQSGSNKTPPNLGLTVNFGAKPRGRWHYDATRQEVVGQAANNSHTEVETCAQCHALGTRIHEAPPDGQPIGDNKRVALLDPSLYFADGQIKGEVFEYGSFIQSRMFHEGVTCSNCHNAHSGELRAKGNAVCTQCHQSSRYDTPKHHHHPVASTAAECVACHMPSRTYMKIDVRHDHSLRVPRPDLSAAIGTPNACNQCHQDKSANWAASTIKSWPGSGYKGYQNYAKALWSGRRGAPGTKRQLIRLINDHKQPAIARATAITLLLDDGSSPSKALLQQAADDTSPLVRRAAATHPQAAPDLLDDKVRSVRIEAAKTLANQPDPRPTAAFKQARKEYLQALRLNADRPESRIQQADLHRAKGEHQKVLDELQQALALDPASIPAAINLADHYRALGQPHKVEKVLQETLQNAPDAAPLHYALGLLSVRQQQPALALHRLAKAHQLSPDNPQYAYVYALALQNEGNTSKAIQLLEASLKRNSHHRPSQAALAQLRQQQD